MRPAIRADLAWLMVLLGAIGILAMLWSKYLERPAKASYFTEDSWKWFIVARSTPGFPKRRYETRISFNGAVEQGLWVVGNDMIKTTKCDGIRIPESDLKTLNDPKLLEPFFELKSDYRGLFTDTPRLALSVHSGSKFRQVCLDTGYLLMSDHTSEDQKHKAELEPFFKIWNLVTQLVPEPKTNN